MPEGKGLLIVYTGPGKGKTTCALGTAFRAVGQGLRVLMVQFIKGSWHYGELDAAKMLGDDKFEIRPMGRGFVKIGGAETDPEDIRTGRGMLGSGARGRFTAGSTTWWCWTKSITRSATRCWMRQKVVEALKGTAGAGARDLHGTQRASVAGRSGRSGDGNERSETPVHQGYTGAAGHRLLRLTL